MSREFDIIVYGATGFTGKYIACELNYLSKNMKPIKLAIAGRNEASLKKVKEENKLDAEVIVADVTDVESLRTMAARTSIVINAVGPFRDLGMPVVTACVEAGTNYLDICGEPEFLEQVQLELDEKAKQTGATVISACGFDSIPNDVGLEFAVRTLAKKGLAPQSVESFLSFVAGEEGLCIHYTTYKCAVEGFGRADELRKLRKSLDQKRGGLTLKRPDGPKLKLEAGPFEPKNLPGVQAFAFPGADASVCRRTQLEHQADNLEGYRAPYHACYFTVPSEHKLKMMLHGGAFQTLAKWGWGRSLLLNNPKFFTNGFFTHEGPSQTQMEKAGFRIDFVCHPQQLQEGAEKPAPVVVSFSGPDPGYLGTSSLIACAALTLLEAKQRAATEEEEGDNKVNPGLRARALHGGVFTPGYVFGESDLLLERLATRGFKVEEVAQESVDDLTQSAAAKAREQELRERVAQRVPATPTASL